MRKMRFMAWLSAAVFIMAGATLASAQMGGMTGGMMEHGPEMRAEGMEHHGDHGAEAMRWKQTLTEDQKMKADKMHLELKKAMEILEAKVRLNEAELNSMVTNDRPDTRAIHAKIGEIAELKKEMLTKKYDHIVEMRSILTPEQRVSFDMGIVGCMHHGERD